MVGTPPATLVPILDRRLVAGRLIPVVSMMRRRQLVDRADQPDGIEPDPDLAAALEALPDKQRQSVAYHYLGGLPYAEIASILGGTSQAARRAAADGIATLRRSTAGATSWNTARSTR
jgi:DNA-directed RNA polymerase specialized sigma24 family protein